MQLVNGNKSKAADAAENSPRTGAPGAAYFIAAVLAVIAILLSATAWAAGGDAELEHCRKLEVEREALLKTNITEEMAKGPEWAKSNLPAERLKAILRYIHVDEQVRFRCVNAFAEAAVAEQEAEARRIALAALEAKRAWEARQKEMLANIPKPDRPPTELLKKRKKTATRRSARGVPPLPVRATR